jgi:hypothetical protein
MGHAPQAYNRPVHRLSRLAQHFVLTAGLASKEGVSAAIAAK